MCKTTLNISGIIRTRRCAGSETILMSSIYTYRAMRAFIMGFQRQPKVHWDSRNVQMEKPTAKIFEKIDSLCSFFVCAEGCAISSQCHVNDAIIHATYRD